MKHIQITGNQNIYYIFPQLSETIVDEEPLKGKTFIGFRFPDGKRFFIRHVKIENPPFSMLTLFVHQESLIQSEDDHISGAVEIVRDGDHFFIIREFITGVSLKTLLRSHSFVTLRKSFFILHFFKSMMEGLKNLHSLNIIHTNLRPSCVYLHSFLSDFDKSNAECVIADFSMAKTIHFSPPDNFKRPLSYLYNPPEVLLSKNPLISYVSDIYSIGIMLYESIKGHHPYRVKHPRVVGDMHLSTPIKDFRKIHPSVEHIIRKCTSRVFFDKPIHLYSEDEIRKVLYDGISQRYQTADEVLADLNLAIEEIGAKLRSRKFPAFLSKYIHKGSNPSVIFDDQCVLCHSALLYMIKHDKNRILRYKGMSHASSISNQITLSSGKAINSIILIENEKIYTKTDAFIKIMLHLGGWRKVFILLRFFPVFIRNIVYNIIATNRYKWWGKKDSCYVPPLHEKYLFSE